MTNRRFLLPLFSLLCLAFGGCDDESLDSDEFAIEWCTAYDDRDARCGDTPSETVDECRRSPDAQCLAQALRPDLASPMVACLNDLACDTSDDGCYSAEGLGAEPSSAAIAFRDRCLAKRETCGNFSDDYCFLDIVDDATVAASDACLDDACDEVGDCLDASIFGDCS